MSEEREKCFKISQKCNANVGSCFGLKFLKINICILFSYLKSAIKNYGLKVFQKYI